VLSFLKPRPMIGLAIDDNNCYFLQAIPSQGDESVTYQTGVAQSVELAEALKSWVSRVGWRTPAVRLSLSAKIMCQTVVPFPTHFSDHDREIAIQMHLSHYFPDASHPLSFDYCFLNRIEDQDYYYLMAVPTTVIQSYYFLLKKIGWKLSCVEIDICVLLRFLSAKPPFNLIYLDHFKKYQLNVKNNDIFFQNNVHSQINM